MIRMFKLFYRSLRSLVQNVQLEQGRSPIEQVPFGGTIEHLQRPKGFTLIELLVVISLIGILASLALVSYTGAQKQTRDAQRKNDLKQYQTSLEVYANKNSGLYPRRGGSGVSAATTLCGDLGISGCPQDPRFSSDASFDYRYQSDGTLSDGTPNAVRYVLWAKLENTSDYWVVCSDGRSGVEPQAGFGVSGGTCPL